MSVAIAGPSPTLPIEGSELRTFRAAWANRDSAPLNILVVGDSNTVGYYSSTDAGRWIQVMTAVLSAANNQRQAPGYQPKNTSTNYVLPWTTSGTITDGTHSGLGYGSVEITPPGYIETSVVCDRFWVRYGFGLLIGAFSVTIDGGSAVNVGTGGTGSLVGGNTWDSGALTRGLHTVRFTAIDGFGFPCRFEGAMWFDGNGNSSGSQGAVSAGNSQTGSKIRVWNGGRLGATAGTFAASDSTWWTDNLDKVNPHLVIVPLGTNEIGTGTSTTAFKANLTTMVSRINSVMATASLQTPSYLFVIPHGTGATASSINDYRTAIIQAAATNGAAVYDRNHLFGFIGTAAGDVHSLSSSLDGAVRVHLSDKGHRLAGEAIADYLLRAVGHRGAGVNTSNALAVHQLPAPSTRTVSATTGTLVLNDNGGVIEATNGSATTLTIPPNSEVPFPVNTMVEICQMGAGQVTVSPGSGVTLRAHAGAKTTAQYATVRVRQRAANEWVLSGAATT